MPIIWHILTVITAIEIQGFNQSKLTTLEFFLSVFSTKLGWTSLPTSWKCQSDNLAKLNRTRPVDKLMINNISLLVNHYPVFVMQDPQSFLFQEIHNLVEANQSFSFCENGLKLNISEVFKSIRTLCSVLLCDRQCLDDWNMNNDRGCACHDMHVRRSNITIQHDIILTNLASPNQDTISMTLFSSSKFTKLYLSSYLSPSICHRQV